MWNGFGWMELWIVVLIATLGMELVSVGLTSIWFSFGALGAIAACAAGSPEWLQGTVFLAISLLMLVFTRPWAVRFLNNRRVKTNLEEIVGSEVRVIELVDNKLECGKALRAGLEWTARARNTDDVFLPDEMAKVSGVEGVKLILEKLPIEYQLKDDSLPKELREVGSGI